VRIVLFCHSLRSDWNHGNAHFLRGVLSELRAAGHDTIAFEPADGWSAGHLAQDSGPAALEGFRQHYPDLDVRVYDRASFDLDRAIDGADVVLVHEWGCGAAVRGSRCSSTTRITAP
jgi:spore maturation protein CgeB